MDGYFLQMGILVVIVYYDYSLMCFARHYEDPIAQLMIGIRLLFNERTIVRRFVFYLLSAKMNILSWLLYIFSNA